jgi:hypothetical protein
MPAAHGAAPSRKTDTKNTSGDKRWQHIFNRLRLNNDESSPPSRREETNLVAMPKAYDGLEEGLEASAKEAPFSVTTAPASPTGVPDASTVKETFDEGQVSASSLHRTLKPRHM